jgi:hypothetical protein
MYFHVFKWLRRAFGLVDRFTGSSLVATTNKCNIFKITVIIAHKMKSSISAYTNRCYVTGLNNGYSSANFPTRFLATGFNTGTITVTFQISLHYSTHKVFTGRLLILLQLRTSCDYLLPRTDWSVAPIVFKISLTHTHTHTHTHEETKFEHNLFRMSTVIYRIYPVTFSFQYTRQRQMIKTSAPCT